MTGKSSHVCKCIVCENKTVADRKKSFIEIRDSMVPILKGRKDVAKMIEFLENQLHWWKTVRKHYEW